MNPYIKNPTLAILYVAASVIGCTKIADPQIPEESQMTVTASFADTDTKTALQNGGSKVYWEKGDQIKVFFGSGSGQFTSTNQDLAATAEFTGTLSVVLGNHEGSSNGKEMWGLYPYSPDAEYDGTSVTSVLPSEQTGRAGSFEKGVNISVAKSSALALSFYNVCGGLRFSLTRDDITEVTFEGLNNEPLAGKIKIGFQDFLPVVREITDPETSITLKAPDGTFEAGKWYYISALPTSLSKGFKLTFQTGTHYATYTSNSAVSIERSKFGSIKDIDSGLTFRKNGEESLLYRKWYLGYYVYGSIIIKFNGAESIDIQDDKLTWAGQQDSGGNGDYSLSYDNQNSKITINKTGQSTKTFYIRTLTEDLLVLQDGTSGPLRYWYTSVENAKSAGIPDVPVADPTHEETSDINVIFSYKGGSTYSSQTPMGIYYVGGHVTTEEDRQWLANPSNEPNHLLANENQASPSLTLWKEIGVTLYPYGEPLPADVNQHSIGDCSFCSVMSSLSYLYPEYIKHIITDHGDGTFTVGLYDPQGDPVDVRVQSTFLCSSNGTIGQVTGKGNIPTWSTVLEKAVMKWETIYKENSLWGIGTEVVAPILTGDGRSYSFSPNSLWNSEWKLAVEHVLNEGMISIGGFTTSGLQCGTLTSVSAHAFAFMLTSDTSGTYLFSMRNPWGITSVDGVLEIPDTRRVVSTIDMRYVYPGAAKPYLKSNIIPYTPPVFTPFSAESSVSPVILKACGYYGE